MKEGPAIWQVVRLDDNGNRYVVARRESREEAQRMADEFTARGHKQTYWVECCGEEPGREAQGVQP